MNGMNVSQVALYLHLQADPCLVPHDMVAEPFLLLASEDAALPWYLTL
jgi:hypothetical protein